VGQLEGLPRHAWHPWNAQRSSSRSAQHQHWVTLLQRNFSLPCSACLKRPYCVIVEAFEKGKCIACSSIRYHRPMHHTCLRVLLLQTRGGKMTVSGVLQHIWQNEGVPGLFRYIRSRQLARSSSSVAACPSPHQAKLWLCQCRSALK
jgi:hypothetical protein